MYAHTHTHTHTHKRTHTCIHAYMCVCVCVCVCACAPKRRGGGRGRNQGPEYLCRQASRDQWRGRRTAALKQRASICRILMHPPRPRAVCVCVCVCVCICICIDTDICKVCLYIVCIRRMCVENVYLPTAHAESHGLKSSF